MLRGYYDKKIKKQPPLSTSQIMGAVLIVFSRGHYIIITPNQGVLIHIVTERYNQ